MCLLIMKICKNEKSFCGGEKMKKLNLYAISTLFMFLPFFVFGQWETVGDLEKIRVSDTTILQYVLSQDGKSIFVLDYNYILKKFDVETGIMVWNKELTKLAQNGKNLAHAAIGVEGNNYALCFGTKDNPYNTLILIKDIETDSLLTTFIYSPHPRSNDYYWAVATEYRIWLSSAYLIIQWNFHGREGKTEIWTGFIDIFRIYNDSLTFLKTFESGWVKFLLINPTAKRLIHYGSLSTISGPFMGVYHRSKKNFFYLLDIEIGSGTDLSRFCGQSPNLYMSNDDNLFWMKCESSLLLIDVEHNLIIKNITYSEEISQILLSNKENLLLLVKGNTIGILNSSLLEVVDTIVLVGVKEILNLKFSPDNRYLYFYVGNEIYRFKHKLNLSPLKAFFYTDSSESLVGETIKFFDRSTGEPESYHWDFGDGTTSSEKNPVHIYQQHGYFKPKLKVTRGGEISEYDTTLTISPVLKANFQYVKDESVCPAVIRFTNTSSGSRIDSVIWSFGDYYSSYSKEYHPVHYYKLSGEYEVDLTVYGMKNSSSIKKKIKINVPEIPLIQDEFRHEVNFPSSISSFISNALELPDKTILGIKDSSSLQSLISLDSTGKVLWEKQGIKGLLVRNPYNGALFLVDGSYLKEIDQKGNILRVFEDPDKLRIGNVGFDSSGIYYGSGKIWREGDQGRIVNYECYYTGLKDTIIVKDSSVFPVFKVTQRKILDKGSDTLEYLNINVPPDPYDPSNPRYFISAISSVDTRVFKDRSGNVNSLTSVFAYNIAEVSPPGETPYYVQTPYLRLIRINDFKINGFTTNLELCGGSNIYPNLCPKNQPVAVQLNDSVIVYLTSKKESSYFFPLISTISTFNLNTKTMQMVPLEQGFKLNSLFKINDTCFAVAGYSGEGLSSTILNQKGEVISMVTPLCRYGEFYHVSITPDKQLLYSGSRSIRKEQYFPYLLKTNLPFLPTLISQPSPNSGIEESPTQTTKYPESGVFPNPTDGKFFLSLDALQEYGKIELYNTIGNVVKTFLEGEFGKEKLEFDISDIPSGIYFLKISQPNSIKILKIIKISD